MEAEGRVKVKGLEVVLEEEEKEEEEGVVVGVVEAMEVKEEPEVEVEAREE